MTAPAKRTTPARSSLWRALRLLIGCPLIWIVKTLRL
jgi:hypothetical protein